MQSELLKVTIYACFLLVMAPVSATEAAWESFAPNAFCSLTVTSIEAQVETEYGQIPYSFARVKVDRLGFYDIYRTYDVPVVQPVAAGERLKRISLRLHGIDTFLDVTLGPKGRMYARFGGTNGIPEQICDLSSRD